MVPKIWFDIRNKENFFLDLFIKIFPIYRLYGENLTQRWPIFMHFLSGFSHFLGDHSKYVDPTRSEERQNEHKAEDI